jgi:hypothetical protein
MNATRARATDGHISAQEGMPMNVDHGLRDLANALVRPDEGLSEFMFEYLKYLLEQGAITEGWKDGHFGVTLAREGVDFDALALTFNRQYFGHEFAYRS